MARRYKLVTFDATNTLLKFRIPPAEQYARAGKMYGLSFDQTLLQDSLKKHMKELTLEHPHFGSVTGLSSTEWWTRLVKLTFTSAGCKSDDASLSNVAAYLIKIFGTQVCWETYPYAYELLERLKQHKISLGVISNFDERLEGILFEVGIRHWFDFVIISYQVKCSKPDPKIFQLALKKAHGVTSEEAIHVGDNVDIDYKAAQNAGWDAVLVQREELKLHTVNDKFIVSKLEDIKNIILPSES